MGNYREFIKDKKRIVIKIGSSSLMHEQTGRLDLLKIEKLVRILIDIKNSGKDVVLVSSGAIAVGRAVIGLCDRPTELPVKQACASIGQAKLMMVYQKIFAEYGAVASQVLLTKNTIVNDVNRTNAQNTFNEILKLGAVPIVNENDTVSTYEIEQLQAFGDNDRLSAIVASIVLKKTKVGLSLRAIGENPATADAAGINITKYKYLTILIGSGISGLGGLFYVMDYVGGSWENSFTIQSFGWLAIALVIFSIWKPIVAIFGSIVFGFLYVAPSFITGISSVEKYVLGMLPYIVTIIVLVITSIVGKQSVQPPAALGNSYFREDR